MFKRAARMNGCRRTALLKNHFPPFNYKGSILERRSKIARFFALQATVDADRVAAGFYPGVGDKLARADLEIGGIAVPREAVRRLDAAFCSDCYKEGKELIYRDISLMNVCPVHLKWYISECPACEKKLEWYSPLYEQCECGERLESKCCSTYDAKPEQYLSQIFTDHDQQRFDQLLNILKRLGYHSQKLNRCYSRGIFNAAIMLNEQKLHKLPIFARMLMDYHPDVDVHLLKAKLFTFESLSEKDIDLIFLHAQKIDVTAPAVEADFLLSREQLECKLQLQPFEFTCLKKNQDFPPKKRLSSWYTPSEIKIITAIHEQVKAAQASASYRLRLDQITADDAAGILEISRAQFRDVLDTGLLKSERTLAGVVVNKNDVDEFKIKFTNVKRFAASLDISLSKLRTLILRKFPNHKTLGSHIRDLKFIPSEHCAAIEHDFLASNGRPRNNGSPDNARRFQKDCAPEHVNDTIEWTSITIAASKLRCDRQILCAMAKKNCFSALKITQQGGYMIPTAEVDNFWSKYISPAEAAQILDYPQPMLPSTLFLDGVAPVVGPLVDHSNSHLYLRPDILAYRERRKTAGVVNGGIDWIPLGYVALTCHGSAPNLKVFMSRPSWVENLRYVCNRYYVNREFFNQFHKNFMFSSEVANLLHMSIHDAWKELSAYGVLPVPDSVTDDRFTRYYNRKDVQLYVEKKGGVSSETDAPSKSPWLETTRADEQLYAIPDYISDSVRYINLEVILKKYELTKKSFTMTFVKHGFISFVTSSKKKYLTPEAAKAASDILDNFYTLRQADKILKRKYNYTYSLVRVGKLFNSNPIPRDLSRVTLIKQCDIHRQLYTLPSPRIYFI